MLLVPSLSGRRRTVRASSARARPATCRSRPAGRRVVHVFAQEYLVRRSARCRSGSGPPTASRCCSRPGRRRHSRRRRGGVVTENAVGTGLVLRTGKHHEGLLGGTSSQFLAVVAAVRALMPSGPSVISGSSAFSGTNTVPPLFTVWSTPWSKNWPKKVNSELYGGDKADVGGHVRDEQRLMRRHTVRRHARHRRSRRGSGSVVHGCSPGLPWVRTGNAAAATAAGFVEVWSTIRLLITRGCESTTLPGLLCVACRPGGAGPAVRQ